MSLDASFDWHRFTLHLRFSTQADYVIGPSATSENDQNPQQFEEWGLRWNRGLSVAFAASWTRCRLPVCAHKKPQRASRGKEDETVLGQ